MLHAPCSVRACSMHLCSVPACGCACVGTYGNLWELRASWCVMLHHASRYFTMHVVFSLRFSRFKAFFHYVFAMQGVFSLRFSRFKVFFHFEVFGWSPVVFQLKCLKYFVVWRCRVAPCGFSIKVFDGIRIKFLKVLAGCSFKLWFLIRSLKFDRIRIKLYQSVSGVIAVRGLIKLYIIIKLFMSSVVLFLPSALLLGEVVHFFRLSSMYIIMSIGNNIRL